MDSNLLGSSNATPSAMDLQGGKKFGISSFSVEYPNESESSICHPTITLTGPRQSLQAQGRRSHPLATPYDHHSYYGPMTKRMNTFDKIRNPMLYLFLLLVSTQTLAAIDRYTLVSRYNPSHNASSLTTPMQVGNGNFAFGADVTGLQTFQPFAIMSSWGWKNDSLPQGKTMDDVNNYHGASWYNHGRLVEYDFGGNDELIEQWLTANPNRVNLGWVGLVFQSAEGEVLNVMERARPLDRNNYKRILFWRRANYCDNDMRTGLRHHWDYLWNDGSAMFSGPFIGNWDAPANHTTSISTDVDGHSAEITHILDEASFTTSFDSDAFTISRDSPDAHRYTILPRDSTATFRIAATYGIASPDGRTSYEAMDVSSRTTWDTFWSQNGFVDVFTESSDPRADELQRRIILSQYLMRVNEAGDTPPQESGLVNNGWYGKFHMEMFFWHSAHWALWNNWELPNRSTGRRSSNTGPPAHGGQR
ncbi:hypothetical protein EDD18DRAFT_1110635 [Armillaria luteobubalina]|uniref:Uncharacterized protein n=1 Tax=Armillaria luteobubalina TaxID=153913 RepID=A0AA39PRP4_9AGAR|nr:hypothetical protein EDD18DRAFT_1110635 [Armillaria luteobubalina]